LGTFAAPEAMGGGETNAEGEQAGEAVGDPKKQNRCKNSGGALLNMEDRAPAPAPLPLPEPLPEEGPFIRACASSTGRGETDAARSGLAVVLDDSELEALSPPRPGARTNLAALDAAAAVAVPWAGRTIAVPEGPDNEGEACPNPPAIPFPERREAISRL